MFFCVFSIPILYYILLLLLLFSSRRWVAGLSRDWIIVHIIIFNILLYNIHYLKRKRKLNAPQCINIIIGDTHINSIIIFYI
jgi:hypothetical protein